jgi:hypothetical protein
MKKEVVIIYQNVKKMIGKLVNGKLVLIENK